MKIVVSKNSGFCFGVKRAVDLTKKNLKNKKNIYSLGPLIHNRWVVSELSQRGLKVIKNLNKIKEGSCIIPSHGKDLSKIRNRKSIYFIDATCPFVFKAQTLMRTLAASGYEILILGDKDHPEVKGLLGISKGKAKVLANEDEAERLSLRNKKVSLVSQTTQSLENFVGCGQRLLKKDFQELRIFNTICRDVIERQKDAKRIARQVDLILVVGGNNSANTKRLAEVCKRFTKTLHIESEKEIKKDWFKNTKSVGIITGASTPGEFISKVKKRIQKFA